MPKKFDVAVKNGEYIGKDGTTKSRWLNVGSVLENENGMYMILDRTFNPAGVPNPNNKEGCFLSFFPAKESQNRAPQQPVQPQQDFTTEELDDEIPF